MYTICIVQYAVCQYAGVLILKIVTIGGTVMQTKFGKLFDATELNELRKKFKYVEAQAASSIHLLSMP